MSTPDSKSWLLIHALLPDATAKQLPADVSDRKSLSTALEKLDSKDASRVRFLLELVDVSSGDESIVLAIATNSDIKTLRDVALHYNQDDVATHNFSSTFSYANFFIFCRIRVSAGNYSLSNADCLGRNHRPGISQETVS